jgi:hypothetical protein
VLHGIHPTVNTALIPLCHTRFCKEQNQANHMYVQEVHTYVRMKKISETMLLYNVYIDILTLTSEYRRTVANLLFGLHSSQGRLTGGSICQALLKRLLKIPLHFHPSSKQHLTESISNSTNITWGS